MMIAKKKYIHDPDYAIPPGESLKDLIESLDMSQAELSRRTELTVQTISRIFNGSQPITYDTANRLERVTGVRASTWNNLESNYQELLLKIAEKDKFTAESAWIKLIPTAELIKRGILPNTKNIIQLVRGALKFYGVNSVDAWKTIWDSPSVAARRSAVFETRIEDASAWVRQGEVQANNVECQRYDKDKFKFALIQIRSLSCQTPDVFISEMTRLCADSGVAVVFVREMKRVPWNGATKWMSPNKALVVLSLRGKAEDKFWFTFFHEAYHVLNPIKKNLLINDGNKNDPEEIKADKFAAEFLIPSKYNKSIINNSSLDNFQYIASELNIALGIVAGRYRFLTGQYFKFTHLISKLNWK